MVATYGISDKMTKKGEVTYKGKPNTTRGITSMETNYTLKDCTFEEKFK
ncbi:hypothetical protein [Aquimarina aggregata]|nr:hypothetical protein [Aquimarina aggregata]